MGMELMLLEFQMDMVMRLCPPAQDAECGWPVIFSRPRAGSTASGSSYYSLMVPPTSVTFPMLQMLTTRCQPDILTVSVAEILPSQVRTDVGLQPWCTDSDPSTRHCGPFHADAGECPPGATWVGNNTPPYDVEDYARDITDRVALTLFYKC